MTSYHIGIIALIISLIIISGLGDSQGFVHASNVWNNGKIVPVELLKSAISFTIGIVAYWLCIRFLQDIKVISPETQTLGWFVVTIVGVAITSGRFFHWHIVDQIVGFIVISGIAWLFIRGTG